MKQIIILLLAITLFGCTVVGSELGKTVDKTKGTKNDKYQSKYAIEGLDIDIQILKAIFTKQKMKEKSDDRACSESGTHQICTASKGCWCEQNTLTTKSNN